METTFPTCTHEPVRRGSIEVVACVACGDVAWFRQGVPVDPDVGMAALFGNYDLVASLPAVKAPGPEVLLYRPSRPSDRASLRVFAPHHWYAVTEGLWLCHDGSLLMLAPTDPLLARNLTRGA